MPPSAHFTVTELRNIPRTGSIRGSFIHWIERRRSGVLPAKNYAGWYATQEIQCVV